jgi:hypothetical protein
VKLLGTPGIAVAHDSDHERPSLCKIREDLFDAPLSENISSMDGIFPIHFFRADFSPESVDRRKTVIGE